MSIEANFVAIIAAAGEGSRFGTDSSRENPKQCRMLLDRALYMWSLGEFISNRYISSIVLVGNQYILDSMKESVKEISGSKRLDVICGGNSRQESVYLGLSQAMSHEPKPVYALIHDAARPLITQSMIDAVAQEVIKCGAATLACSVPDTVKHVNLDTLEIEDTLNRNELYLAQTPQGARIDWLIESHRDLAQRRGAVTDDAYVLEQTGRKVKVVPGTRFNIKVTHEEDMEICRFILSNKILK